MPTTDLKRVTLTFDNGPHPESTPYVLDVLAKRQIKTTFFVVGKNLEQSRGPAQRAVDEGHWIGNHTWSHSSPFGVTGDMDFVRSEIDRAQDCIGSLAHPSRFFRPFNLGRLEGALNRNAAAHLAAGKFTCVLWNAVPGDFKDTHGWPQTAHEQIARCDWPVVVLHDAFGDAMRHLDRFLGELMDQGCTFEQSFPSSCIAMQSGSATDVLRNGVLVD
jgi:peptidoglycan/xylan/chitin deacetylase (PgdA/CDA1 family)